MVGFGFGCLDVEAIEHSRPSIEVLEFSTKRRTCFLSVAVERQGLAKIGDCFFGTSEPIGEEQAATFQDRCPFGLRLRDFERAIEQAENPIRIAEPVGEKQGVVEGISMLGVGFEDSF